MARRDIIVADFREAKPDFEPDERDEMIGVKKDRQPRKSARFKIVPETHAEFFDIPIKAKRTSKKRQNQS